MITSLVLNHERNILLLCLYELLEININLPSLGFIFFFSLLSVLLDIFHSTPSFFAIEFDFFDLVSARGTFLNLFRWLLLNILLDCLYTETFTIIARNLLAFGSIEPWIEMEVLFNRPDNYYTGVNTYHSASSVCLCAHWRYRKLASAFVWAHL